MSAGAVTEQKLAETVAEEQVRSIISLIGWLEDRDTPNHVIYQFQLWRHSPGKPDNWPDIIMWENLQQQLQWSSSHVRSEWSLKWCQ